MRAEGVRHNGRVAAHLEFAEFRLADDTAVRVELAAVGQPALDGGELDDVPVGFERPVPVGRGGRAAEIAAGSLRWTLRPLAPLLQEVHDSLGRLEDQPDEVSVEFGVQIGQDLKLGIVGANGQASMKVCATWRRSAAAPDGSGAGDPDGTGAGGAAGAGDAPRSR